MPKTKNIGGYPFIEYQPPRFSETESLRRSSHFCEWLTGRRSVRDFSDKPVSIEILNNILVAASSAPSGANKQPWTFCVVSEPHLKKQIRIEAEKEEYESYHNRMGEAWLEDLRPLQTDWQKPFLEIAPWLIIVFKKAYDIHPAGSKRNNYYVSESVGIACGFLIAAIHNAGLCTLTHTPSPMNFLTRILKRPENERPYLLLPVGYPADETFVPDISRKKLSDVTVFY